MCWRKTGSVSVQVFQQSCQRASPAVVSGRRGESVRPKRAQWAQKTGCWRHPGREDAVNMRYTTTDAPNKPLNAIQEGSLGDKMGIADVLLSRFSKKLLFLKTPWGSCTPKRNDDACCCKTFRCTRRFSVCRQIGRNTWPQRLFLYQVKPWWHGTRCPRLSSPTTARTLIQVAGEVRCG